MTRRVVDFKGLVATLRRAEVKNSAPLYILPPERRRHAEGAAATAAALAARYGYGDVDSLGRAALWHDVARSLSLPALRAIADWRGFEPDADERAGGVGLLHGPAGAAVIAAAGSPGEAAAAVRYHVTGRPGPTLADKIVMAADAAEPSRTHLWADAARAALSVSLDLAVAFWVYLKIEAVKAAGAAVHPRAAATLASFEGGLVAEARRLARPFV